MTNGLLALCLALSLLPHDKPEDSDPYSLRLVSFELKMRSGGKRVIHGSTQKRLPGLGDRVAVAPLKLLDQQQLSDAQTVRDFLPIIENAFLQPQSISIEADKKPDITLFLLYYLRQNIADVETRQAIQQTMDFVKQKTKE